MSETDKVVLPFEVFESRSFAASQKAEMMPFNFAVASDSVILDPTLARDENIDESEFKNSTPIKKGVIGESSVRNQATFQVKLGVDLLEQRGAKKYTAKDNPLKEKRLYNPYYNPLSTSTSSLAQSQF
jgi:hypothetical protein